MFTFKLADSSTEGTEGQRIRFFQPSQKFMPEFSGRGDVVLIRGLKRLSFGGGVLISNQLTTWVVFPGSEIPSKMPHFNDLPKHSKSRNSAAPTLAEVRYVLSLKQGLGQRQHSPALGEETLKKLADPSKITTLKHVCDSSFFNIVGQVIRTYPSRDWLEIYVSDYTSNSLLFDYHYQDDDQADEFADFSGQKRKWPGPYGTRTLQITLFPPHALFAQEHVSENDFVRLQSVNVVHNKNTNLLEGKLRTDKFNPERVNISVLNREDDTVKDVLRNKRTYEQQFKAERATARGRQAKKRPSKSHDDDDADGPNEAGDQQKVSRNAARKKRRK